MRLKPNDAAVEADCAKRSAGSACAILRLSEVEDDESPVSERGKTKVASAETAKVAYRLLNERDPVVARAIDVSHRWRKNAGK